MYQVLYRKWRPKTFEDVIGQEHIVTTLKNEVTSGHTGHAYLFTGTRGTGKTTCAKILAKAINCEKPVNGSPCLECSICRGVENESIMDITEIDAASNNGVENIRSMREEAFFSPTVCKYRVYIVDEVHMLSAGAFNAFLKILEEPPEHVVFILATTEIHKLPATIVSRCQRFDFYRPKPHQIVARLKFVCEKENIKIEESAAKTIAELSDGAVRDALSILDRCIDRDKNEVTDFHVREITGAAGQEYILDVASAICSKNTSKCLEIVDDMHTKSKNLLKFCEEILEYFRNLIIFKTARSNNQSIENLEKNAEKITLNEIFTVLDVLQTAHKGMQFSGNAKLETEIALMKICAAEDAAPKQSLEEIHKLEFRIEKLEKAIANKNWEAPSPRTPKELSRPMAPQTVLPDSKNAVPFDQWDEILKRLDSSLKSKSISVALKDSHAYTAENFILIEAKNSLALELLRESANREALKNIVAEVTGKKYNLGPYTGPPSPKKEKKDAGATSSQNITEAAEEDPMDDFLNEIKDDGIEVQIV